VTSLRASGTTILLTTHYLDEAEHLADRVGVINDGRVIAVDTVAGLGAEQRRTAVVSWQEGGEQRSESTADPTAVVVRLADQFSGTVPGLEVRRPDLEDVYVAMIEGSGR
jgi:ABC-2 type transport system ATP-binding protein